MTTDKMYYTEKIVKDSDGIPSVVRIWTPIPYDKYVAQMKEQSDKAPKWGRNKTQGQREKPGRKTKMTLQQVKAKRSERSKAAYAKRKAAKQTAE